MHSETEKEQHHKLCWSIFKRYFSLCMQHDAKIPALTFTQLLHPKKNPLAWRIESETKSGEMNELEENNIIVHILPLPLCWCMCGDDSSLQSQAVTPTVNK
jgi:hypothetical protein